MEQRLPKSQLIHVVDPAVSVQNKPLTVPIEDVPPFKESAKRKCEILLKVFTWQAEPCSHLSLLLLYIRLQLTGLGQ